MAEGSLDARLVADCFKALGHPVRVELVRRILDRERCVTQLQGGLGQSQPSISQHLGVLRDQGLVVPVRKGNRTCYRAADEAGLAALLRVAEALLSGVETAVPGPECEAEGLTEG
jgi:DNA-binding transcriptional ArsR family regulator